MQSKLESQDKLVSMIVHDMRNPSEAINNGLNQAKQKMNQELSQIVSDIYKDFSKCSKQIGDIKQRGSQLEFQNSQILQKCLKRNSQIQSSKSLQKFESKIIENHYLKNDIQKRENKKFENIEEWKDQKIIPRRQFEDQEESKHYEPENDCFLNPKNFKEQFFQKYLKDESDQIQQFGQNKEEFANINSFRNRYYSENHQAPSHLEKLENQPFIQSNIDDMNIKNEENKNGVDHDQSGKNIQAIFVLIKDLQNINQLINDQDDQSQSAPAQIQNVINQQIEEDDNYEDFDSDDLEESQRLAAPQNQFQDQNQIVSGNLQVNQMQQHSDVLVNLPRTNHFNQGSKYLKRYSNRDVSNNQQFFGKEVIIFKENTVLTIDRSNQTENSQNDDFKSKIQNLILKVLKDAENIASSLKLNSIVKIQDQILIEKNQDIMKEPKLIEKKSLKNIIAHELLINESNEQIHIQNLKIKSQISNINNSLPILNKKSSNMINENQNLKIKFQSSNLKPNTNSYNQEIQNANYQIISQNKSESCCLSQFDQCSSNCQFCKIYRKIIVDILKKLKKILRLTNNIEFYIDNSINSSMIISNLTEDLLTMAKIKNGAFELNIEKNVSLLQIVVEAFQVLSFSAEQKSIIFQMQIQKSKRNILQSVTADKRRILQVLLNFLSNSIKFTSKFGYIQVTIKVVQKSKIEDKNQVSGNNKSIQKIEIQVQDNGAGISKKNIEKLFSDFGKLNEHKHMNIKGTGLGLSICKKIIEQLGGSVTVISKVGVGSNFVISLDLEAHENLETNELEIQNQNLLNNFRLMDQEEHDKFDLSLQNNRQFLPQNYKEQEDQYEFFKFINVTNQKHQNSIKEKEHEIIINKILKNIDFANFEEQSQSNIKDQPSINFNQSKSIEKSLKYKSDLIGSQNSQNKSIESFQLSDLSQYQIVNQSERKQNSNNQKKSFASYESLDLDENQCPVESNFADFNLYQINEQSEVDKSSFQQRSKYGSRQRQSEILSRSGQSIESYAVNFIEKIEFKNYLCDNQILKQVFEISQKYRQSKLNFLIANDDSFQIHFIQTIIDQMKQVSSYETADNGQTVIDKVKNMVPANTDQKNGFQNHFNAIFLDLDMPIVNGYQACKMIQEYYYSFGLKNKLVDKINEEQFKINLINQPLNLKNTEDQEEEWIADLKYVYDVYQQFKDQESLDSESSQNTQKEHIGNQILKVFKILFQKLRYKSLVKMNRPFIFAYSALVNQIVIDNTNKYGFDKCVVSPLNKLRIEGLLNEYIDHYSYQLTKLMLENLGPVPDLEDMIDINKIKAISSFEMYNSFEQSFKQKIKHKKIEKKSISQNNVFQQEVLQENNQQQNQQDFFEGVVQRLSDSQQDEFKIFRDQIDSQYNILNKQQNFSLVEQIEKRSRVIIQQESFEQNKNCLDKNSQDFAYNFDFDKNLKFMSDQKQNQEN